MATLTIHVPTGIRVVDRGVDDTGTRKFDICIEETNSPQQMTPESKYRIRFLSIEEAHAELAPATEHRRGLVSAPETGTRPPSRRRVPASINEPSRAKKVPGLKGPK